MNLRPPGYEPDELPTALLRDIHAPLSCASILYHVSRMFVKENGEPMIPDGITAWLSEFSKRHDLPHINPHAFRHTMASILINSGKDVVSVSKRLGHAKVSTTTDIYSHIIMEADEQASECLADVMLRPTKKKAAM